MTREQASECSFVSGALLGLLLDEYVVHGELTDEGLNSLPAVIRAMRETFKANKDFAAPFAATMANELQERARKELDG